ncbi:hypothetical protein Tco_1100551 [Tanacetum coccineum]
MTQSDHYSGDGPRWSATVDRHWPPLTATVDRRWPPLTAAVDRWLRRQRWWRLSNRMLQRGGGAAFNVYYGRCTRYCASGGWMNHKLTRGTWRLLEGSVRGAGDQISVQGSGRGQYKASIPEASRWTDGMI